MKNQKNKQEIFPLYVGKCKVIYTNGYANNVSYNLVGVHHHFAKLEGKTYELTYPISECKLILRRVSNMGEEHKKELCDILVAYDFKVDSMLRYGSESSTFKDNVTLILWLVANGYALDDEWFDNGVAVEA